MSERNFILVACVVGALGASCTPYEETPEQPKPTPPATARKTVTDADQQKLQEERKKAQEEAEQKIEAEKKEGQGGTNGGTTSDKPKRDYEFATPVPGKTGFVFSPYNNKVIDVRDIPSGTLVQDPTYPASEKKYFRVP